MKKRERERKGSQSTGNWVISLLLVNWGLAAALAPSQRKEKERRGERGPKGKGGRGPRGKGERAEGAKGKRGEGRKHEETKDVATDLLPRCNLLTFFFSFPRFTARTRHQHPVAVPLPLSLSLLFPPSHSLSHFLFLSRSPFLFLGIISLRCT